MIRTGFKEELADVAIRLGTYAGALGIDLEAEIIKKDGEEQGQAIIAWQGLLRGERW